PVAAYSPDGQRFARTWGGNSGIVHVLEAATGKLLRTLTLSVPLDRVAFAPDGRHLLTGNADGTVYVFRLAPSPLSIQPAVKPPLPLARSPFDQLKREAIPADELKMLRQGGDVKPPPELVAILGDSRLTHG